jgi:hypothetical protein
LKNTIKIFVIIKESIKNPKFNKNLNKNKKVLKNNIKKILNLNSKEMIDNLIYKKETKMSLLRIQTSLWNENYKNT